eukprot:1634274-Rhodomonas_salina.1
MMSQSRTWMAVAALPRDSSRTGITLSDTRTSSMLTLKLPAPPSPAPDNNLSESVFTGAKPLY